MASNPPALQVRTPTPSSPAVPSSNMASPVVGSGDLLALPPSALPDAAAPSQVQSARGPGPAQVQHPMRSDELATTTSAHRRAVTSGNTAEFDWPPPIPQPIRNVSSSSSIGSNAGNSGGLSASPVPSFSPGTAPLLHELPPNESLYMQGLLTKKGGHMLGIGIWRTTRLYMLTDTALSFTDKSKKNVKCHHLVESFKEVVPLPSRRWPNRCFSLRFEDGKVYHLRATSVNECTQWIDALSKAILAAGARKNRWRFMRENSQMQHAAQLQQMGIQLPTLAQQQAAAAMYQQQQQFDQMGMQQMPLNALALQQAQLAQQMQSLQLASLGYGLSYPVHPAAFGSPFGTPAYANPGEMEMMPTSVTPPTINAGGNGGGTQRMKSRVRAPASSSASSAKENSAGGPQPTLSRADSKGKKQPVEEAGAAPSSAASASAAAAAAAAANAVSSSSDAELDGEEVGLSTDDDGMSADENATSGPEDEPDDFYADEDDDGGVAPYYHPPRPQPFQFDLAAAAQAAAFAQWQQSQSHLQIEQMAAAQSVDPLELARLNRQKDRIPLYFGLFTLAAMAILLAGNQGRTAEQFGDVIARLMAGETAADARQKDGPLTSAPAASSNLNASLGGGNAYAAAAAGAQVASALPSVGVFGFVLSHLVWLLLLVSCLSTVVSFLAFRRHKKSMKQRQAKKKADEAREKAAAGGKSPVDSKAAQARWKAESAMLENEIKKTTRLMGFLGATAASTVAIAAYAYRA